MKNFLTKTFGGLSTSYYIRNLVFALLPAALVVFMEFSISDSEHQPLRYGMIVMAAINTLLYPYSRFVYESAVDFVIGRNVFAVNAIIFLLLKIITIIVCWFLAVFIAPIGLIYLYFRHSKSASMPGREQP